jgi:hypothetical protein
MRRTAQRRAVSTDPLEAFIGSIHSVRGDLARRHRQMRPEPAEGLAARNP